MRGRRRRVRLIIRHGLRLWGSEHDEEGRLTPIYGIDQTAGIKSYR